MMAQDNPIMAQLVRRMLRWSDNGPNDQMSQMSDNISVRWCLRWSDEGSDVQMILRCSDNAQMMLIWSDDAQMVRRYLRQSVDGSEGQIMFLSIRWWLRQSDEGSDGQMMAQMVSWWLRWPGHGTDGHMMTQLQTAYHSTQTSAISFFRSFAG